MSQEPVVYLPACEKEDCTVASSGRCLEGFDDYVSSCPHYQLDSEIEGISALVDIAELPKSRDQITPTQEDEGRVFWAGHELGLREAVDLMKGSKTHLIGLVGISDVGKTCFLNSLYLKMSSSEKALDKYDFSGSKTLRGFEERASYARVWRDGSIPDKLSERTQLQDPRQPGFMHLRLSSKSEPKRVYQLLLTDLPGEWFETLINDASSAERLVFLERADGILFFVDGERLREPKERHKEVQTCRDLLGRLHESVQISSSIPLIVVVSKIDCYPTPPADEDSLPGLTQIVNEAQRRGYQVDVVYIASFSRAPNQVPNGYHIEETLDKVLTPRSHMDTKGKLTSPTAQSRSFACFGAR